MPQIYFGTSALAGFDNGSVLTIGAFDGVHRGHQAILARLAEKSTELKVPSVAVTFHPDPATFFQAEKAPPQIMSWREKTLALLNAGVDKVVCLQFNDAMRDMSAQAFGQNLVAEKLGAKFVIVGDDFRFGRNREGSIEDLRRLGSEFGFEVEQSTTFEHAGARISSTRIRDLLGAGNLAVAEELLGKPYEICGRVVRGEQMGRQLGFPTANVPLKRKRLAISGVFAVRALVDGTWYRGAANVGYRPALNTLKKPLLEVHLLDFDGDIYGKPVRVRFEKKVREETNFDDLAALKAAIARDIETVKAWFGHRAS